MSLYSWFVPIWIQTRCKQCINYERSFQQWSLPQHENDNWKCSNRSWVSIYQRFAEGIHISVVLKVPPNSKTVVLEIRQSWVLSRKYSDRNACLSTGRGPAPLQLFSPALVVGKVEDKDLGFSSSRIQYRTEQPFSSHNDWCNGDDYADKLGNILEFV